MKTLLFFGLVAAALGVVHATYKSSDFTDAERWEATQQGVQHAHAKIQSYKETQARAATAKKSSDLSAMMLAKFFRRASPRTEKIGHARVFIEEAVKHTERTLFEKKRAKVAAVASKEEQAEMLAAELFHKPGSLLSEKEYGTIYQQSECEELRESVDCNTIQFVNTIRTPDGTCNNLDNPTQGASETEFRRLLPPRYEDGLFMPNGVRQSKFRDNMFNNGSFTPPYPSARLVSTTIIRDREDDDVNTHLLMQWGQFVDHDLDLAVEFGNAEELCVDCECTEICAPIPVPMDDQSFGVGTPRDGDCHPFARTVPACPNDRFAFVPREQVNELTHYLDGSQVYGSTEEVAKILRQNIDGLLKVSPPLPGPNMNMDNLPERPATPNEPCPRGRATCFFAGDVRVNEQVSLTVMHTIWLREHNRIARELKTLNPDFDDERLYQDARRIVIAQLQQIIFTEYLPIILGPTADELLGPYLGYLEDVDVSVPNAFATAAYRFGHSQIQPQFDRLGNSFTSIARGPLSLVDAFMNPQEFFDGGGTDPIVRGWITQPARVLDEFMNSILTNRLFEMEAGMGLDLATLNIQRSRDHGLPPYLVWKNYCEERFNISSEFQNELTKIRLLQTYGSLDTVDLFVGALAEEPLPGAVVGATLACIFTLTFANLRDGDRFWYESANSGFTVAQLEEIKRTSLARVLCDNTNIGTVQTNPFQQGTREICSGGDGFFSFLERIPGIRFDPAFREDPFCYLALEIEPHSRPFLQIDVINAQQGGGTFQIFPLVDLPPGRYCVPYECPTNSINTAIVSLPPFTDNSDMENFLQCVVTVIGARPNLPGNVGTSVYQAFISPNDLDASGNGIYGSNSLCEADSSVALSYNCDFTKAAVSSNSVTTSDLENELARILSDTSDSPVKDPATSQGGTYTNTRTEIYPMEKCEDVLPHDICEDLKHIVGKPKEAEAVKASETTQTQSETKTEELVHLLEATLQELKEN